MSYPDHMGAIQKLFVNRSIRLQSRPERSGNLVRFDFGHYDLQTGLRDIAQYADVSATGMRLVSRTATTARIGDVIRVEFTIPGEEKTLRPAAQVVRTVNEFVFAVKFHEMSPEQAAALNSAILREMAREKWSFITGPFRSLANWASDNQKGIWISLAAWLVIGGIGVSIYLNSDAYQGKKIKGWGKVYPKEWYRDYVKGFNVPDGTGAPTKDDRSR